MKRRWRKILSGALALCGVAFVLIYTRPLTIEQRYPFLDLSECTQIRGYYDRGKGTAPIPFLLQTGDPDFQELLELFHRPAFRTKVSNLLPSGTKVHRYEEGDFRWSVMFRFEEVLFPDGSAGSGDMLHVDNFFGKVTLSFDGENISCTVENQEQWLREVMDIITRYPQ